MKKILMVKNDLFLVTDNGPVRSDNPSLTCCVIYNEKLLSFCNHGIDIHYELQTEGDKKIIRLDCHAFPYYKFKNTKDNDEYKNALCRYYRENIADNIINIRRKLKNDFSPTVSNSTIIANRHKLDNFTCLVYEDISNSNDVDESIIKFIENTYDKLIYFLENNINFNY